MGSVVWEIPTCRGMLTYTTQPMIYSQMRYIGTPADGHRMCAVFPSLW